MPAFKCYSNASQCIYAVSHVQLIRRYSDFLRYLHHSEICSLIDRLTENAQSGADFGRLSHGGVDDTADNLSSGVVLARRQRHAALRSSGPVRARRKPLDLDAGVEVDGAAARRLPGDGRSRLAADGAARQRLAPVGRHVVRRSAVADDNRIRRNCAATRARLAL